MTARPTSSSGMPMRISVVTTVLNPDDSFCLTAESILQQDHGDVEWIVIDGQSWGTGAALLDRYRDRMDYYVSRPDDGVYHAMNGAWEIATGDYMVFLNAGDTFYRADTLSRLAPQLRGGIVYGDHDYVGSGTHLFRKSADARALLAQLRHGDLSGGWHARLPCHQATYYRRGLFAEMQFNTRFQIAADHDLFLRYAAAGGALHYVDQTLCRYAAGGFSARSAARCRAEWITIYSRFSDDPDRVRRQFIGQGAEITIPVVFMGDTYDREGPYPDLGLPAFNWVRETGLRVVVKQDWQAPTIRLWGRSRFAQSLRLWHGTKVCGQVTLPEGHFTVDFPLGPVARGDMLTICSSMADVLGPDDGRKTGWAFEELQMIAGGRS